MKYIIFLSLLILTFSIQAAPVCSTNGTAVIYTNGVTTKKRDANIALVAIKALGLNSQIDLSPDPKKVPYILAYNYEESLSRDFLEAAVQRFPVGFVKSFGVTNSYAAYMGYLYGGLSDAIYAVALNSITEKLLEIQSDWLVNYRSGSLYLDTIREIKGHYETAFNQGQRVFAISHSQGGLFMSDVFDRISFTDKRNLFSGFQIASPLRDEMNSHFGYATHDKDRLINFIRGTIGALPANITAPSIVRNSYTGISDYAVEFVLNHGIMTTYFNDSNIRAQIIPKLIKAAQLLESNCLNKAVINYTKSNLQVNFDSINPENPNVTDLTYSWNFGDGQIATTASKIISHNYLEPGIYSVSLVVTEANGRTHSVTEDILVEKALVSGDAAVKLCMTNSEKSNFDYEIYTLDSSGRIEALFESFSFSFATTRNNSGYPDIKCQCKTINLQRGVDYALTIMPYWEGLSIRPYGYYLAPENKTVNFAVAFLDYPSQGFDYIIDDESGWFCDAE